MRFTQTALEGDHMWIKPQLSFKHNLGNIYNELLVSYLSWLKLHCDHVYSPASRDVDDVMKLDPHGVLKGAYVKHPPLPRVYYKA